MIEDIRPEFQDDFLYNPPLDAPERVDIPVNQPQELNQAPSPEIGDDLIQEVKSRVPDSLRVFEKNDFVDFGGTILEGQYRRAVVARDRQSSEKVIIKLPRLKQFNDLVKYLRPGVYSESLTRLPLSEERRRQLEKAGVTPDEMVLEQDVDWEKTLKSPEFTQRFTEEEFDRLEMAQIAADISPAVSRPIGIYFTKGGMPAEIDLFHETTRTESQRDIELTVEQQAYFHSEIQRIADHGLVPALDMMSLHNLLITGEGPEDIKFLEAEFVGFDPSKIKINDENTEKFKNVWERYSSRNQKKT